MSEQNVPLRIESKRDPGITLLHIILLLVLCLAYLPVLQGLISVWSHSDEYSHGFFILPISLYIVWKNRHELFKVEVDTRWYYFIPFLFVLCFYALSSMARVLTLASLFFPLAIAGLILFLYGPKMLKRTIFPVSILILMIPVPEQIYTAITIHLQLMVSKVSVFFAAAADVPIYRQGNVIHLPGHTLQVVQACSGLRSLISLLTLCLIVGYFGFKSNLLRTILSAAAVPVAFMVNVIRVFTMIIAFYFFNIDFTTDSVHSYFGLAIFFIALIMICGIYKGLAIWEKHIIQK